jgi:radical SAM superfamily enzyme YgiQ (UPF0313 family)
MRSPSLVVDDIMGAKERHPNLSHLFIVDAVFNVPPAHAKAVCREMISRRMNVPWTCYLNPAYFDEELAALMAEAYCAGVEIGSESGCDPTLKRLKKGFTVEETKRTSWLCREMGIKDCHTFILGTPGESLDDVRRTLDFITELQPFSAILMVCNNDSLNLNEIQADAETDFQKAIRALLKEKAKQFPAWIIPCLHTNFDLRLFQVLRRRGLKGPLWQHIRS